MAKRSCDRATWTQQQSAAEQSEPCSCCCEGELRASQGGVCAQLSPTPIFTSFQLVCGFWNLSHVTRSPQGRCHPSRSWFHQADGTLPILAFLVNRLLFRAQNDVWKVAGTGMGMSPGCWDSFVLPDVVWWQWGKAQTCQNFFVLELIPCPPVHHCSALPAPATAEGKARGHTRSSRHTQHKPAHMLLHLLPAWAGIFPNEISPHTPARNDASHRAGCIPSCWDKSEAHI